MCLVSWVLKNTYFKERLSVVAFNIAYTVWKTILRNLNYVKCLNLASMKKAWFMAPMEKTWWPQSNIHSWFIAPMEKAWFHKILFFEKVIVMVKDKKYSIKDATSVKISFRHHMKWTRIMLPVVFEEFEMVYI